MVSWSGHILPVAVTVAVWFLATGWSPGWTTAIGPRFLAVSRGLA